MAAKLIFIGVLHGDNRIKKALNKIKPDVISIEMSQKYWKSLIKNRKEESHAEVIESIKYSKKKKIPIFFIDIDPSKKEISEWLNSDVKTKKELSKKELEKIYRFFKKHYTKVSKETENILSKNDKEFDKRTNYMSNKLKKIVDDNEGKLIVHIGGAGHFLNTKTIKTLYTKLINLKPKRFILTDLI